MDNPLKCIPKFIINLRKNTKRLTAVLSALDSVGSLDFYTVIRAIEPHEVDYNPEQYIDYQTYENIKHPKSSIILPSFGSLACALSHIKAWKHIIKNGIREALIIEDDIVITDRTKFHFDLHTLFSLIKYHNNTNILVTVGSRHFSKRYLDAKDNPPYSRNYHGIFALYENDGKKNVEVIQGPIIGTHFYYVNNSTCAFLLDHIRKIKYQIDIEIGLLSHRITMYNINTKAIQQNKYFASDVQLSLVSFDDIQRIFTSLQSGIINKNLLLLIYSYIPYIYKKINPNNNKRHQDMDPSIIFNSYQSYHT